MGTLAPSASEHTASSSSVMKRWKASGSLTPALTSLEATVTRLGLRACKKRLTARLNESFDDSGVKVRISKPFAVKETGAGESARCVEGKGELSADLLGSIRSVEDSFGVGWVVLLLFADFESSKSMACF